MEIQEYRIQVNNIWVNYKVTGMGRPVLLMHGWLHNSEHWADVQKNIAKQGYQVIAVDLLGFGKSQDPPASWNISEYADFIVQFVKALNLNNCTIAGHSFGGRIAIKLGGRSIEEIKDIILIDAAGMNTAISTRKKIIIFFSKLFSILFYVWPLSLLQDKVREIVYKRLRNEDYLSVNKVMRKVFLLATKEDLKKDAARIIKPTLIVWGETDRLTPLSDANMLHKLVNNSQLEIIKDIGHSPNVKAPEELSKIIVEYLK